MENFNNRGHNFEQQSSGDYRMGGRDGVRTRWGRGGDRDDYGPSKRPRY